MNQFEEQLKRVNDKFQHFMKQYQLIQKENDRLKKEVELVSSERHTFSARSEKLQQQMEIIKSSKGEMNEEEKKAFEKRLNQYIKEIDKCIAMLND